MKKTLIPLLLLCALLFVSALITASRSKGKNVILRRAIIFR
jgi:hypothetical protein